MKKHRQKNEIAWQKNEMHFIPLAKAFHIIISVGNKYMGVQATAWVLS